MKEVFYITTPLYYVNAEPHLGHSYSTVAADCLARFARLQGKSVFFLTGTDEHGSKIAQAAREKNLSPQELSDQMVVRFKELWQKLNISYDDFIRTTESRHTQIVQEIFSVLYQKGDIYLSEYEGWYCLPCESFVPQLEAETQKCPDCGRQLQKVKEESYFFKISRYLPRLLKHITENKNFVLPPFRRQEVINILKSELKDLSVSRTTVKWSIPVPFNEKHTIYVWFDALINYISAAGYRREETRFNSLWPADVHLMAKDILKFHAIIWPCLLMALELPLPKVVFAHGWWVVGKEKMSKSKGNVVNPLELIEEFGLDALRYFLLREITFGADGSFSRSALITRLNSDLANDLGNLLNRTLAMVKKYRGGILPSPGEKTSLDEEIIKLAEKVSKEIPPLMERLEFQKSLIIIWDLVKRNNKYIEETSPWKLMKENKVERLNQVFYVILESLRIISVLVYPFIPQSANKIRQQLGLSPLSEGKDNYQAEVEWGQLPAGQPIGPTIPLFPRVKEDLLKLS
jgi:methionyl-tRNA synthetase